MQAIFTQGIGLVLAENQRVLQAIALIGAITSDFFVYRQRRKAFYYNRGLSRQLPWFFRLQI
jgi:hypothetical protein